MKMIKTVLVGAAAAAASLASAIAQDFGAAPADYQYAVEDYVFSRLENPRGAQIRIESEPYPVYADFGRHGELEAWAVDISVRARLNGRSYGEMPYTVIFYDGEPVAFEDDIRGVEIAGGSRMAYRR